MNQHFKKVKMKHCGLKLYIQFNSQNNLVKPQLELYFKFHRIKLRYFKISFLNHSINFI